MRLALVILILASSSFAGCIYDSEEKMKINLIVEFERTNGTIVETYVGGDLISIANASIDFHFSKTNSVLGLVEFGVEYADGSANLTVHPDTGSMITVQFSEHGIYDIIAYAIDEKGLRVNLPIVVRMDLRMEWSESGTYNPEIMEISPIPNNGGPYASFILIDSTVSNPVLIQEIGGGRDVDFTWKLYDELGDACQYRNGNVDEGESVRWKTAHFNTFESHELRISYDDGQDDIDVEQTVSIEYPHLETMPNSD